MIGLIVTAGLGVTWLATVAKTDTVSALQVAGHISSIAYSSSFLFTLVCFVKRTHANARDFLVTRDDIQLLKESVKSLSLFQKRKKS